MLRDRSHMKQKPHIASNVVQSEIRNMSIECAKVNGINLSQGFSDTDLHPVIRRAAQAAISAGHNHYTRYDGIPRLRRAIAKKLAQYNGIQADPDENIVVTSGSTAALFCVLFALCQQNDEVIVFEPYYGYHLNTLFALKLKPKYHRLEAPEWGIDLKKLEALVTSCTRAIIVNTPTNPSGKVFSEAELRALCEFARRHNLYVITDEIYEYFLYDGATHVSPGSFTDHASRVITISGYSKTFSITGWRIGYLVCPAHLTQTIGFVHDLMYVCAPAPLQTGVVEGIDKLKRRFYLELATSYRRKRDILCGALDEAGLRPIIPAGAYYVLADISAIEGDSSKAKVMRLLKDTKIAAVPGMAFYHDKAGENLARFCFAKRDSVLLKAARILRKNRYSS